MFNRYFGKTLSYEEAYINENNEIHYKEPIIISGSLHKSSSSLSRGAYSNWLHNSFYGFRRTYRVPFKIGIGSMLDNEKVTDCVQVGFGNRIDYYLVSTIRYEDIFISEKDLTMNCTVERIIGYSELNNIPIYSEPEILKTWMFGQKDIFKHAGNGVIDAISANGYAFMSSANIKAGDKVDGFIVSEVNEIANLDGSINHLEAYVCK